MAAARLGRLEEARTYFGRCLRILEHIHGPSHPDLAGVLQNLTNIAMALGDNDGALVTSERALAIGEATLGPNHPDLAWALLSVGGLHRARGEQATAIAAFERALTLPVGNDEHALARGYARLGLAQALHAAGREPARVRALVLEAIAALRGREVASGPLAEAEALRDELAAGEKNNSRR